MSKLKDRRKRKRKIKSDIVTRCFKGSGKSCGKVKMKVKTLTKRLKKNIESYNYDINKFKNYAPKKFDWQNPEEHGNKSQQIGFIAQDLESIDSRWVGEIELQDDDEDGYDNPDLALVAADKIAKTSKFSEKDAMYISVIQQLITRIEALEG